MHAVRFAAEGEKQPSRELNGERTREREAMLIRRQRLHVVKL